MYKQGRLSALRPLRAASCGHAEQMRLSIHGGNFHCFSRTGQGVALPAPVTVSDNAGFVWKTRALIRVEAARLSKLEKICHGIKLTISGTLRGWGVPCKGWLGRGLKRVHNAPTMTIGSLSTKPNFRNGTLPKKKSQ